MSNDTTKQNINPNIKPDGFHITQILEALVKVSPFIAEGDGEAKCIYCHAPEHCGEGKHYYDCPYAAAKDYVDRVIVPWVSDND